MTGYGVFHLASPASAGPALCWLGPSGMLSRSLPDSNPSHVLSVMVGSGRADPGALAMMKSGGQLEQTRDYGQTAVRIIGIALGEPIAEFFLEHECQALGYEFEALRRDEFVALADHIAGVLCDIVGPFYADDLARQLRKMVEEPHS